MENLAPVIRAVHDAIASNPDRCIAVATLAITAVGAYFAWLSAKFARLAYRRQVLSEREKFKVVVSRKGRDWSHATIAITNKGAPCVVNNIKLVSASKDLFVQNCSKFLKHGADTSFSVERTTFDRIPVDVENRIVITLSDETVLETEHFVFKKEMNHTEEVYVVKLIAVRRKEFPRV